MIEEHIIPFRQPERSDWRCYLFGYHDGIVFTPVLGKEPCWFHRKMQTLILGHKWIKKDE